MIRLFLFFLMGSFFISCWMWMPLPLNQDYTKDQTLCYDFEYDFKQGVWTDKEGQPVQCVLYDNQNFYPPLGDQGCDYLSQFYNMDYVKFQQILIQNQLVCVKQEFLEFNGTAVPLSSNDYCFIPEDGELTVQKCPGKDDES